MLAETAFNRVRTGHFLTYLRNLFLDLRNGLRAARRQREMIEAAREEDRRYIEARPQVLRVGELRIHAQGFGIYGQWEFFFPQQNERDINCLGAALTYPPVREDLDGTKRIYGYTLEELKELHARRAEFNVEA